MTPSARIPGAALVTLCMLLSTGCADDGTPDSDAFPLRIAPTSPSAIAMAPTWVAQALGFYEEEGLDVEIIGNVPGGTVEDALTSGDIDLGGSAYSNLWPRVDELTEAGIQIRAFLPDGAYAWRLMVLEDSPYRTHEDLIGETIGITEAGGDETTTEVLMSLGGVGPEEYETVVTGGRAAGGVALESGEVAAFQGSYVDEAAISEVTAVRTIETGDEDSLFMGGWAARADFMEENPDVLVKFGRAWAKAAVWTFENPEAAIDLIAEVNPESVGDRAQSLALLEATNEHNRPLYEQLYKLTDADVSATLEITKELGLVVDEVRVEDVFTSQYLDEIWDFDLEAVAAEARDYEG